MKKIILFFLIGILIVFGGDLLINAFGPVQILRLAGYKNVVTVNCYPQWINDEEYYYLEVTNYNDGGTGPGFGIMPVPCSFFWGKISNADFLIYKVNTAKPNEKELVAKLAERVSFTLGGRKINRDDILFRVANDIKQMALILRIPMGFIGYDYMGYFFDVNGKIFQKKNLDWKWRDCTNIADISFDLDKIKLQGLTIAYIKNVYSGLRIKSSGDWKWLSKNISVSYFIDNGFLKIYFADGEGKNRELVFELQYPSFEDSGYSLGEAAISKDGTILFLSKIGIFKKENGGWKMIKDLKDTGGIYYPNVSPNDQRLVGVMENNGNIAVFELKELLR